MTRQALDSSDNRTSMVSDPTGRGLEEEVAALFREAGCDVSLRVDVPGARGIENVDVFIRFETLGMEDFWAVECKDHRGPVKRADVQVLQHKVENVGASRGVMVSRSGYQKGCHATVKKSNVLLTSIEELKLSLEEQVSRQRLQHLLARVSSLLDELQRMEKWGERIPGSPFRRGVTRKLPTGPGSDQYFERIGKLALVKEQVSDVLMGAEIFRVPSDEQDPYSEFVSFEHISRRPEFCDVVEQILSENERWAEGLVPPK